MRRAWLAAPALAGIAASCAAPAPEPAAALAPPGAAWVVDPGEPGPALPPAGRSLFDFVVAAERDGRAVYDVPYPFEALVRAIGDRLGPATIGPPLKLVLVPRGRSLQRDAAEPDFFRYPRAVVATDAEPRPAPGHSGLLLKDRLYLGYQEKADIVEVISYNEAAGRFEFQVVRDYRAGARPRVVYANRALCLACHQNAAPIFARPLWDETNANPAVAERLSAEHRSFYGFPLEPGVDIPYLIDSATDRANLFAAWQLVWRDACGGGEPEAVRCRADLLTFVLQYRLSGGRGFDRRAGAYRETFLPRLAGRARGLWPAGLRVPTADLPNRNPALPAALERESSVPSEFEPLLLRAPLAVWPAPGTDATVEKAVAGLAEFLAAPDVRGLDAGLARATPTGATRRVYESRCTFDASRDAVGERRFSFECRAPEGRPADGVFALRGRVYVDGGRRLRGTVDSVAVDGREEMPELRVTGGAVRPSGAALEATLTLAQAATGLRARRANGEAVESLVLSPGGRGLLRTVDDFAALRAAVHALARRTGAGELDVLGARPFRRASVMKALGTELGLPPVAWCCDDDALLPDPVYDTHPRDAPAAAPGAATGQGTFLHYCGRCHDSEDRFPPNFLHGSPAEVDANLVQCAERIYFRLEMWGKERAARPKTPMPPESALPLLDVSHDTWPRHADLRTLQARAASLLETQPGAVPRIEALEARGYGSLRPCLPER